MVFVAKRIFRALCLFVCANVYFVVIIGCLSSNNKKQTQIVIKIQFESEEYEEIKYIPTSYFEKKDLLLILSELSQKDDPSMRFISTNRTEEIMEVNGLRSSWKEGWVVRVNGAVVTGLELKRGIRVGYNDKIQIRLETVEREFGRLRP
ncbi:hypothetical protein P3G55_08650 [Leptospira sp. 96542]|nr:hypothetical protein [Leptospira sp. 96542]